jgi:hypothetical protein
MISLYVPDGDLKAQLIDARVRTPGVSGREPTYTMAYIELIFTFYRLVRHVLLPAWRVERQAVQGSKARFCLVAPRSPSTVMDAATCCATNSCLPGHA